MHYAAEWPFGTPRTVRAWELEKSFQSWVSIGEPLLNGDGKSPGGLAFGSFGLARGSVLNNLDRKRPLCYAELSYPAPPRTR